MIGKNWLVIAVLLAPLPASAATPHQLFGKSIRITYVNVTSMRPAGSQQPFRTQSTVRGFTIYISDAGRTFMRLERYGGSQRFQVGNSGKTRSGGAVAIRFDGHSMTYGAGFVGGATHAQAYFSENFDSCTAKVLHGKEGNRGSYVFKSKDRGILEIESSEAIQVSCSIGNDNPFAH